MNNIKDNYRSVSVILLILFAFANLSANLIFERNSTEIVTIAEDGAIVDGEVIDNSQAIPSNEALIFETQGEVVTWVEPNKKLHVKKSFSNVGTVSPTSGDLCVTNSSDENVLNMSRDAGLAATGSGLVLTSNTTYIDDFAVYTSTAETVGDDPLYVNIVSPNGLEGRIDDYDQKEYKFYVKDHLGSTRAVIKEDDANNPSLFEDICYSSYGIPLKTNLSEDEARETFTGKEFDQDGIDLYDFEARAYDPEIGTFTSTDLMEEFWNPYSYTGGNPVNFIDPTGLFTEIYIDKTNYIRDMHYYPDGPEEAHVIQRYFDEDGKLVYNHLDTYGELALANDFYNQDLDGNYLVANGQNKYVGSFSDELFRLEERAVEQGSWFLIGAPIVAWKSGFGEYDFKDYHKNEVGGAYGFLMTSRDAGNAIWGRNVHHNDWDYAEAKDAAGMLQNNYFKPWRRKEYKYGNVNKFCSDCESEYYGEQEWTATMNDWGYRNWNTEYTTEEYKGFNPKPPNKHVPINKK